MPACPRQPAMTDGGALPGARPPGCRIYPASAVEALLPWQAASAPRLPKLSLLEQIGKALPGNRPWRPCSVRTTNGIRSDVPSAPAFTSAINVPGVPLPTPSAASAPIAAILPSRPGHGTVEGGRDRFIGREGGSVIMPGRLQREGFLYLLHWQDRTGRVEHYIGWTTDLEARLKQHFSQSGGCPTTRRYRREGMGGRLARLWKGTMQGERWLQQTLLFPTDCPVCAGTAVREVACEGWIDAGEHEGGNGPCGRSSCWVG
jgi:hypothetical protein